MSHVMVVAQKSFLLGKDIKSRRSPPFPLSRSDFVQLQARGLVKEAEDQQAPKGEAGTPPSASPAAPASPEVTATSPAPGAKSQGRRKKGSSA
jgi:hypothetical protein